MTPSEIVSELDRHIVGQTQAKRAVAIALRNRWRRQQVDEKLRAEITPKNILMIGPTGVGKTEIARRLARLADAPFVKVEATKFTEVGYVGKDVDTIVRDLVEVAVKQERERQVRGKRAAAEDAAEERLLDLLVPPPRSSGFGTETPSPDSTARQVMRKRLREGTLDDKEVELEVAEAKPSLEILGPQGMEEMAEQLKGLFSQLGQGRRKTRKLRVREALRLLTEEEAGKLVNEDEIRSAALAAAESNGIVFIDEIDKVASRSEIGGADVSRQGVQRDLLPLVEGTSVNTKYGMVRTDHILFIASGAFHLAKPSDLIPELQGRFPIRVELGSLSVDDFEAILTRREASLVAQYQALLATEGVRLEIAPEAVRRIAQIACDVNERTENIGARRLATVMERLLDEISFDAPNRGGEPALIDAAMVDGAASLASLFYGMHAGGQWNAQRGTNLLDGGSPFYDCYLCADGGFLSVAPLEPKFFAEFARRIGLDPHFVTRQYDRRLWPEMRAAIAERLASRSRDDWAAEFEGTDACVAPVLGLAEAPGHPHALARQAFIDIGGVVQPAPAPRFERTPPRQPRPAPRLGEHTREVLLERGFGAEEVAALLASGDAAQAAPGEGAR